MVTTDPHSISDVAPGAPLLRFLEITAWLLETCAVYPMECA